MLKIDGRWRIFKNILIFFGFTLIWRSNGEAENRLRAWEFLSAISGGKYEDTGGSNIMDNNSLVLYNSLDRI